MVLLTHYHSLASFTSGCGITPDIHAEGGHTFRPPSLSSYCMCDIANGNSALEDMVGNQQVRARSHFFRSVCLAVFVTAGTVTLSLALYVIVNMDQYPCVCMFKGDGGVRRGGSVDGEDEAATGVSR